MLAQTDRGTVTGTVADPAGAVVASANVQAKNAESGASGGEGVAAIGEREGECPRVEEVTAELKRRVRGPVGRVIGNQVEFH